MLQRYIYRNRLIYFQVLFISIYAHIYEICAATTMQTAHAVCHVYIEVESSKHDHQQGYFFDEPFSTVVSHSNSTLAFWSPSGVTS